MAARVVANLLSRTAITVALTVTTFVRYSCTVADIVL